MSIVQTKILPDRNSFFFNFVARMTLCSEITDCFFINNQTDSIELVSNQTKIISSTTSDCFSQYCRNASCMENRSNVKLLKTGVFNLSSLSETFYKSFKNLQVLDISYYGAKQLTSAALNLPYLEILNASHNNLINISEWIFLNLPNLKEIDFSYNQIAALYSTNFRRSLNLTVINVAHNKIATLESGTFRSLTQLRSLNLCDNLITIIDKNLFSEHKLDVLQLDNNPIVYIDCKFLSMRNISLENVEKIDISCLGDSVEIDLSGKDEAVFGIPRSNSELRCPIEKLKNLTFLNISGNRMKNISNMLELLGPSIKSLDVSLNFIGKLNSKTFKKFNNLQYLNLSHTNLSNFGFKTFYHQNKLKILDLSFNQLKKVNFTLFIRNFKNLTTLNLEGNDLVEINTVTRANFPALSVLGISKNHFTCDYLATFVRQWESLHLFHNPSDETHIDGVDCHHYEDEMVGETSVDQDSTDFRFIERILLVLCIVCCGYMLTKKSKTMQEIKQNLMRMWVERNAVYRSRSNQNNISLIDS